MLDHLALLSIEKSINNTQWEGKQTFLRRLEVGEFGLCHFFCLVQGLWCTSDMRCTQ